MNKIIVQQYAAPDETLHTAIDNVFRRERTKLGSSDRLDRIFKNRFYTDRLIRWGSAKQKNDNPNFQISVTRQILAILKGDADAAGAKNTEEFSLLFQSVSRASNLHAIIQQLTEYLDKLCAANTSNLQELEQKLPERVQPKSLSEILPEDEIDHLTLRFATLRDYPRTEQIYRQWFEPDLSVDDAEGRRIFARESHFRVVEITYNSGEKRIVGYYSVWPLARVTLEAMISGELLERQLTSHHVFEFDSPKAEIFYVSEMCVEVGAQFGATLIRDGRKFLCWLFAKHPNVRALACWAYSKVGTELAKRHMMEQRVSLGGVPSGFYEISREQFITNSNWRGFTASRIIRL